MANEIQSLGSYYKSLVASDFVKAAITAFFTAVLATLYELVPPLFTGAKLPSWAELGHVAVLSITAGVGAIMRKYFTNAVGQPFKKDPPVVQQIKKEELPKDAIL